MSKVWKYGIIIVVIAALLVVASGVKTEEEKLYHSAISKVDKGGCFLRYSSHTELVPAWQVLCGKLADLDVLTPQQIGRIRGVMQMLQLSRLQAVAASIKQDRNHNYRLRQAILLSTQVNPDNRNIDYASVQALPDSIIFAAGGKLNAAWCWMLISRLINSAHDPQLRAFYTLLPKLFQQCFRQDFYTVLDSIKGEYLLAVFGTDPQHAGMALILPDSDGKLGEIAAAKLGTANEKLPRWENMPDDFAPVIRAIPGKLIFASSEDALRKIHNRSRRRHLSELPGWEKLAGDLPGNGVFYCLMKYESDWRPFVAPKWRRALPRRDYHLVYNLRREYDAYAGLAITDLPMPKLMNLGETFFLLAPFLTNDQISFGTVASPDEEE